MRKEILHNARAAFSIGLGLILSFHQIQAQQNIITAKDNTRPEVTRQFTGDKSVIASYDVAKYNGYNEITWQAFVDPAITNYTLEYSIDGRDFVNAGAAIQDDQRYVVKHYTKEQQPLMYRIKSERGNGPASYTLLTAVSGVSEKPVTLQSTSIRGNIINVNAKLPVQRINITATSGRQVYARDVSGQTDFISTTIPGLGEGIYFITFVGNGWQDTQKFIVLR